MVAANARAFLPFFIVLAAWLRIVAGSDLVKDNIIEVQDVLEGTLWPENITVSTEELLPLIGFESARGAEQINSNPLALRNLFKRAGCTFYRTGEARTCITTGDICCTDPNAAQDGWCCPATDGCGPGTGTLGKCTYRISYTTSYYYYTSYTTDYSTYTTTVIDSTYWTTLMSTEYETVTRSNIDTYTEWTTVTLTQNAKKARAVQTGAVDADVTPLPGWTVSVPKATAANQKQDVIKPEATEPPKYLMVRGVLFPRQALRTDTSTRTVYTTTYISESSVYTSTVYDTETSTDWSTTTSTRTSALGAKTTVHSTQTVTLRAGETIPIQPQETDPGNQQLSGGGSRRTGLSTGAKAGIGVGTAGGSLIICLILGFFIARRRKHSDSNAVAAAAAAPHPPENKQPMAGVTGMPPGSPPPASGYSQSPMQQMSPVYGGTPSPGPMYNYGPGGVPMQGQPVPFGAPIPHQQQQQQYQYPRPPSPAHTPGSPNSATGYGPPPTEMYQQQGVQQQQPSYEMPTVYSPAPQPQYPQQPMSPQPQPQYPQQVQSPQPYRPN
ncbi:hypothetical protein BDV96DRAFT_645971 [Lophiotrema nucula]|uniref:Mid2 domain-containing protein n=1 Tax=Lophiotrema nucula TaxID=690887 RepID=A0A6A5Z990_9PLEO|nr:hypothetical protein BDV96DRAFT_645971 [Lophiotrema nucula]